MLTQRLPSDGTNNLTTPDEKWIHRGNERCLARRGDRVGQPQLDKCLPSDADTFRFAVDRTQQVHGKIDVHALDFAARTPGFVPVKMLVDLLGAGVEEFVKLLSRNRAPPTTFCARTPVFRAPAHGGPR